MKTILVPTDFSENAVNALYYAIDFAKKGKAKLILLHAYQINYPNPYVPLDYVIDEKNRTVRESESQLKAVSLKIIHSGNIEYEYITVEDSPVEAILNAIKEKEIDLVIMGTKGDSNILGTIFGTNSAKIIEKATCPVLVVPDEAIFKEIKKITYATVYNHSDVFALKKVVEIARLFKAQVNVLHISDKKHSMDEEKKLMKTFMDDVNHKVHYHNMAFELYEGENIEDALEKYIYNDSTSILVMSTHQRNFFDKLFGRSVTKQMAYHTSVPLMAFHHTIKSAVKVY